MNYLTPWNSQGFNIFGAAYDDNGLIVTESLRHCGSAAYKHRDPAYLTVAEMTSAMPLLDYTYYLGHCFSMYGHFLIETLPMLSFLLDDEDSRGVFMPWSGITNISILADFLAVLGLDSSRVYLHNCQSTLQGNFKIASRPINVNNKLVDATPYTKVLSRMHTRLKSYHHDRFPKKIFMLRANNRVDTSIADAIIASFQNIGFVPLFPERYSVVDQIMMCANARAIAGFRGSQLHNSIFCRNKSVVIEIGDIEMPSTPNPNQRICDLLSNSRSFFISYSNNKNSDLSNVEAVIVNHSLHHL